MESLIDRYKSQEISKQQVIEEIMNQHGSQVTRLAYSYVKDLATAEDITQEVMLKCYQKLDSFKGNSALTTWVNRIAINKCKDHLKSGWQKYMQFDLPAILSPKTDETPESELSKKVEHDELTKDVLQLPVKYREVIILHYYQEMATKDIAELLHIKDTSVRTRLRRARQLLEEYITKRNEQL